MSNILLKQAGDKITELEDGIASAIGAIDHEQPHQARYWLACLISNAESFKSRLTVERAMLELRLKKLTSFMESPAFEAIERVEQDDLRGQRYFMESYLGCLNRRIDRITWQQG